MCLNLQDIEVDGVQLEVEFEYESEERPSMYSPGDEESIEILSVNVGNIDISGLLDDDKISEISQILLGKREEVI